MNPGLISRQRLRPEGSRPDRGRTPYALAVLLLAVTVAGVASAATPAPVPAIPRLHAVAATAYLGGTQVPAPPVWLDPSPARIHGRFVFRPATGSTSDAAGAFEYYLTTMQRSGWTLSAKADPTRRGTWTMRWAFGPQSVLLTYTTTPTERFTVDDCPPEPYC